MSEFHSLAHLIKRLEVATTRLEDLALSASSASAVSSTSPTNTPPPPSAPAVVQPTGVSEVPVVIEKQDEAINAALQKYLALSAEIGEPISKQATLVASAIQAERDILRISTLAQKPVMSTTIFGKLIDPLQTLLTEVVNIKEKNRGSAMFNHLSTVAEGIPALGWFTCEPAPSPFIRDMKDAAQFYANRVAKEWKEKDPKHVEWSQAFLTVLDNLGRFVKENYPTGLPWNPKGENLETYMSQNNTSTASAPAPTTPAPAAGGPPPPPPPPPPAVLEEYEAGKPTGAAAVFAEINKGTSVTAGLRKVDKSQMTHKNPSLRAGSSIDAGSNKKQAPPTPSKPNKYILKKPARTTLEANKWVVENHENNNTIVIEDTAINQAVYIFGCKNSTIRIKGKVNAVTMDSCVKCGIAIDSTVSTVDLVNCKSFALQVFHVTPTIAVDKCDSGEIYLSKECLGVEILSAKSSSLNVLVPEDIEAEDSEMKELFVPEQLKTTIVDGKLVTTLIEHA
ncbi:adenylate cyclase associated N terminal-domain-containing protein [Phycomyces blakesleeanus]|uniref:Adenylyl cyclase-associated protein n=1 Tax=Phycomyces blakesleeanus TaxID=4837 RepID=A0ABR3BH13_PHYBL